MTSHFNRVSLSDDTQSNLLRLNHQKTIDTETYININNYYQIGSVNCNFVIKRDNEDLLIIDDSNITFNVNIDLDKINVNNEAVLCNAIIENDLRVFTSNVNINSDIILSSNSININKTTFFNSNIHTDTLYVDTIDSRYGRSIIINKLQLNESVFDNPELLNSVNIIRNTLDSSNIINIDINNNNNLENILKVADTITINKNGEINIKKSINISSNSIYLPELSIDNKNHLTIGDTKNPINVVDYNTKIEWESSNNSLLHIHRKDIYEEYNIIKDPLLYITVDYEPNCNIIRTNYDQTELIFSNLELTLSSNITTENHIIYLDLLPPVQNAIWSSNTTPLVINPITDDPFLTTSINLHLTDYDYNEYTIFTNGCKSSNLNNLEDGITEYDIDVYIGFYKTEDIKPIIVEKTNEHKKGQGYIFEDNLIGCNIEYCNIIENNYSPYNIPGGTESIIINFDIHILYEKSDETEVMYYINTDPIIIECPLIMHCEFSNNDILTLNSNGLLRIKDLDTLKATISDLTISNIHNDVNFRNNDITNVNTLELNNIIVNNTINAETITTTNINILGDQKIQFTKIDTSNFDSAFFKYNNTRTNFFNEVTLCEGQIEYELIEDYRSNNDISGFLISSLNKLSNSDPNPTNENIAYFDGNVKIIGELQTTNINTSNTLSIKDHIRITDNVISLGDYLETSTNKNKIWFGNYSKLLDYDQDEANVDHTFDTVVIYDINLGPPDFDIYKNYYNYFITFYSNLEGISSPKIKEYANKYNINMFGNVRVATINNETILELSDYTDIHDIPKNTMNVYGNIKCCKPFMFEEDTYTILSETALTANGNINCKGDIISDGFISTEKHIEAKKGVRNISDSRVKYDLKKIENAVDKLKSLSGYTFKRKDLNGIKDTGLLAQDVRSVLPEVVNENHEGILSIEYSKMMGLIVEAIKELNVKIDLIK
tara:strand:- start:925 stop:3768 length:2844 start_codon:yes stop_codon:yes gene_type:complete